MMARHLSLLSETEFTNRVPDGFPVGCPTLDLSATREGGGRNVLICRPPGQVVSKIHQVAHPGAKSPEPLAVTWKPDGQFLAVGWSDGVVRLMGLENTRAAHHIDICPRSASSSISHIGWACTQIVPRASPLPPVIRGESLGQGTGSTADLPRELTFLEIDTALPLISPLPGGSAGSGEDASVFTLRTGIDFLFRTPTPEEYDQVNVMIVGSTDGTPPHLVHVSSSPRLSTHALLLAATKARPEEMFLTLMDLPFISSVPINLSLLTSKLTSLQKLLRYLKQTQLHMQLEWANTRELPSRFLRSVQAGLEELTSGPRSIVPALYHTVVTGHAHEPVREWLVESLAERGHKRWDKAVVSGLENLRSLVHENFLPALERCSIILSRLRGLAQFHDAREDIGFSVTQVSKVADVIACLTLVGHRILLAVMDELDHFTAFSQWLRFQIDRLVSSSADGDDLTEKEATVDNGKVLTYIERYLTDSPLRVFLGDMSQDDRSADWARAEDGMPSLMDLLDAQIARHQSGQEAMNALPRVEFLVDYATHCSNRIFEGIAQDKKRSVRLGPLIQLSIGHKIDSFDMRMYEGSANEATVYAAVSSKESSSQVHIFRVRLSIINGISSRRSVESCVLDLGHDRRLVDLGFLGDGDLVLLCTEADNSAPPLLVTIPVNSPSLEFGAADGTTAAAPPCPLEHARPVTYSLPGDAPQRPVRMQLHDAANVRGEIAPRICLLGANKTTWHTFTLPTSG